MINRSMFISYARKSKFVGFMALIRVLTQFVKNLIKIEVAITK